MELRQLQNFVAVAETGSITAAAKRIFLTQSALSRQMKALESELGICLFERQAHSIRLTPAGEALLREARELLARADQLAAHVRQAGSTERLRVGFAPSLAAGVLSSAVGKFTLRHAEVRVEISDLSTAEMLAGLEKETLDVVITVGRQRPTPGLVWSPLYETPWCLAVHHAHRLAARELIRPDDVRGEALLGYSQRDYPEYWQAVTAWLRKVGLRLAIASEYHGAEELMAAVESGLGIALTTAQAGRLYPRRVKLLALDRAPKPVAVVAGHRETNQPRRRLAEFLADLKTAARAAG